MPALDERPELTGWQEFVIEAYATVSRDRQLGFAVGPIPWTAIDRFVQSRLERGWIDRDEAADLETLIIAIDDHEAWQRLRDTKAGKDSKPDKAKEGATDDGEDGQA